MKHYSVIIPTLNEAKHIHRLLSSLVAQTLAPTEVLLIDGNSDDETQNVAAQFYSKLPLTIVNTQRGVGFQRQFGGSRARTELLFFFDADVHFSADFIEKSLVELELRMLSLACPTYKPETDSFAVRCIYAFFNTIFFVGQKYYPAGAGSCIIVTAALFKAVGGFTTTLLLDDLDFIYRAGTAGSFGQLHTRVYVSDRRFMKYGILPTFWQYLQVSYLFVRRQIARGNSLHYEFGVYDSKKVASRSRTK